MQDSRLLWIDVMWIDEEGGLRIPAAQVNRTKAFNGGKAPMRFPTTVFRMEIGAKPLRN